MKNVIQAKAKEKQESNLKQNITVSQKSDERYVKNPMRKRSNKVDRAEFCLVRNLTKQMECEPTKNCPSWLELI